VTEAKRHFWGRVGIDGLAGPSEVLIIADETADPASIAADLLAQAEHDPVSRSILISTNQSIAEETLKAVSTQLEPSPLGKLPALHGKTKEVSGSVP
jgi:histidinol dehydrogenase (EC 1.1.1.23)